MIIFNSHCVDANILSKIGTATQALAVTSTKSLGEAILLMEHYYGGISEKDFCESRKKLQRLEDGCRQISSQRSCPGDPASLIDCLSATQALSHNLPKMRQPVFLTDFLLKRPDWSAAGGGCCFPIVVLGADFGAIMDVFLQFVLQSDHINLFHPSTAHVLDLTGSSPYMTTLQDLRETGDFGERQQPGPASAAVATWFLNLAAKTAQTEEQARLLLDVALAVYPEYPAALTARATVENNPEERERFLTRALDFHPRYTKALDLLSRLYESQQRFEEFKDIYRRLLREKVTPTQ